MSRLLVILCLFLAGCSAAEKHPPMPRPKAYPRPNLYSAHYVAMPLPTAPGKVLVNSSASVKSPKPGWFDVDYPNYNITVNCTLTPITEQNLAEVIDNRRERMARNVDGEYFEVAQWCGSTLIVAPSALRTPVQFLATDSVSYVLSGVAVGNYPANTSADSIAPYVNAVAEDISYMLKML